MRPTLGLVVLILLSATLVACEQKAAPSTTPIAPAPAAATDTTPPQAAPADPNYAGTYAVQDTAVCTLSITISKQANEYRFATGAARGQVQVKQQGTETYFTFVGLQEADAQGDIEAIWQDSMLVIQNYGNSMNEYIRFAQCDAKYLELIRQQ